MDSINWIALGTLASFEQKISKIKILKPEIIYPKPNFIGLDLRLLLKLLRRIVKQ